MVNDTYASFNSQVVVVNCVVPLMIVRCQNSLIRLGREEEEEEEAR